MINLAAMPSAFPTSHRVVLPSAALWVESAACFASAVGLAFAAALCAMIIRPDAAVCHSTFGQQVPKSGLDRFRQMVSARAPHPQRLAIGEASR